MGGASRSIGAGDVRRTKDHLAESSVGRLREPAAFHHRFQILEDQAHGLGAAGEDRVADEGLDPFDNGRFDVHADDTQNTI
jgi:hypothetical protein